jgi:hypothetical protein
MEDVTGEVLQGFDNFEAVSTEVDERELRKRERNKDNHYLIPVPKTKPALSLSLPSDYFFGFNDKVFVISLDDLVKSKSQNDAVKHIIENQGVFRRPAGVEPFVDFAGDTKRNLNIVVETEDQGRISLQTVHDALQVFGPEDLRRKIHDEKFVNTLYCMLGFESYGIPFEKFKAVAAAYYQKLMYLPKEILDGAIPLEVPKEKAKSRAKSKAKLKTSAKVPSYFTQGFSAMYDLVFAKNGDVYLDIYQPVCQMVDPNVEVNHQLLTAQCPAQVFIRLTFDEARGAFAHPLFFCNEHFLPFLFDKVIWKAELPAGADDAQKAALEESIKKALQENKVTEGKVERTTMGKHGPKIIVVAAAATAAVVATVVFAPGAVPALLAAYFGYSLTTTAAAVTVVAVTGVSAGGTSATYLLARKLSKRGLSFIELDKCRLDKMTEEGFVMVDIGSCGNSGIYLKAKPNDRTTEESKNTVEVKFKQ